ncbi:hypothetical protein ACMATS_23480 [Streptoverticillium reticulum]|uniref:hypothetical protein n=1 Tax=Streptoverticillium reticulum TaxID=1433415 RepID=UPI0039BF11E9
MGADRLHAELESLKTFKGRVDELLASLHDSAAAPGRVAEASLGAGHLGVNFAEAGGLYSAYNEVHAQLEQLSQLFADLIEAMGTAVLGAHDGYANVDAELKERMWAAQRRAQELGGAATPAGGGRGGRAGAGAAANSEGTI